MKFQVRESRSLLSNKVASLSVGIAILVFCLPAFSQLNLGRILGTVTDQSGGVIVGANVTVTDQDRGTSRTLTTDQAGAYAAPSLVPGNYTVHVEAMGFNTFDRKDILVQVGSDTRVDVTMQAGSQTQTITVTEQLPLINTTNATLGGVVEGTEVNDLPILGRNYQDMLQFQPGVTTKPGGGANGHSSNGLRSDGNNWLFEGAFDGGVRTAGSIINTNSHAGDGATVVPEDAIQEFGGTFQNKAEYGWKPGVASNVNIKSGTNDIHGTAFAVGQTSNLNARNPFNPPPNPIPELAYEQYGATVGGPIKKDKLFYYVAFEGMEFLEGTPTSHTVPTTALIAGDAGVSVPAAYLDMQAKGQIPAGAIDANGNVVNAALLSSPQQLSAKLVGLGLFQTGVSANGVFPYGFSSQRFPNKNFIWKVDDHLNDKNTISGEYFLARDIELQSSGTALQQYWETDDYLTGNVARANWTYLPNSTWANEFHFGLDRKVENTWPAECGGNQAAPPPDYSSFFNTGATDACLGYSAAPANFAFPDVTINGFTVLGADSNSQRRVEGYWGLVDSVSHTSGNHNIKFGGEFRRPYYSGASYTNAFGAISFGTSGINAFTGATALEDFLMGVPSTGSLLEGNPSAVYRNYTVGMFIQDDWRLTRRLTINLGLRYEYETPLTEDNNKLAIFDPNLNPTTGLVQVGTDGLNSPFKTDVFGPNLQPRFGAVYDVTGKGTTIVRAAYGVYSNWPVWDVYSDVTDLGGNPTAATYYSATGVPTKGTGTIYSANVTFPTASGTPPAPLLNWSLAGPVYPSTATIKCGDGISGNPGPCSVGVFGSIGTQQNWTLPYVNEWTLGIQHELTSTMSLDLSYVGNHGTNLLGPYDLNMPTLGTNNATRIQESRPYFSEFPWMGTITDLTNKEFSNYNALQATLTQHPWHGLSSTVGYTYSRALDSTSTDITQQIYPSPQCPDQKCNYGPSSFDSPNRLTARVVYMVPGKKGYGQLLEGWQVSTLVNFISGLPWNGTDTSDNFSGTSESNERWSLVGNIKDFDKFGRFASIPCYGITGSTFGNSGACTTVANVNLLPAACVDAANSLPTNPSVPSTDPKATGLDSLASLGCYMSGNSVIVPPAQGTVGNMSWDEFRGYGLRLWDFSVRKDIRLTERVNAQFQFNLYNVTNTTQFAPPNFNLVSPATFGASTETPNVANGNVIAGTGDGRRVEFGLHIAF